MDQLNRLNNRHVTPNGPAPAHQNPIESIGGGNNHKKNKKNGNGLFKIILLVTLIVISVLAILVLAIFVYRATTGASSKIKGDKYQAVFLNSADGQVYFGKLKDLDSEYYELKDIYYVRVEQVQPNQEEQTQQNISLAKLGNEIHGPEDVMYIRKDQVLFWENLKEEGQVVTAINDYINNGNNK